MSEALSILSPPRVYPVTLAEAKLHLRVTHTAEDLSIGAMIAAACEQVESACGRSLSAQRLKLVLDDWPFDGLCNRPIRLQRPPLTSVESVRYMDGDGDWQTLDSSLYTVLADDDARVAPVADEVWPDTYGQVGQIEVTYQAGYPAAVIASAARVDGVITFTTDAAHGLSAGAIVTVSGCADSGFDGRFVVASVDAEALTFTVVQSGEDDETTGGQVTAVPERLRQAVLLAVQMLYERGDGGMPGVSEQVKRAFDALVGGMKDWRYP